MRIRIFTDGACSGNPGPGGWGAVILLENEVHHISGGDKNTTNNRMELKAVIESLRLALDICNPTAIDIHSDSAYVVNAITNGWLTKWKFNNWRTVKSEEVKNKDLWLQLDKLFYRHKMLVDVSPFKEIKFIKVKGHAGNKYNELCDQMAKREVLQVRANS